MSGVSTLQAAAILFTFLSLIHGRMGLGAEASLASVDKGLSSGIRQRRFIVVKTEREWNDLWQTHATKPIPPQARPTIDFEKESIVAVFLGEQWTGGHGVEITKMEEDQTTGEVIVFWRETRPPAGSMTIQALRQPYHIVKTRKIDLPARFVPAN